jgi:hypothetical protein
MDAADDRLRGERGPAATGDLIPENLLTALGCPGTAPVVKQLCEEAKSFGGKTLDIYGLAQSAGQLTNFGVLNWTQRIKLELINPLLGNNCYIGSNNSPIVVNPQLSVGPAVGSRRKPARTRSSTRTPSSSHLVRPGSPFCFVS